MPVFGINATGVFDFHFALFEAPLGGAQVGSSIQQAPVVVTTGLFSTGLDFGGGVFTGASRWLEIAVRTNGSSEPHTLLLPRQPLTPTPTQAFPLRRAT